MNTVSCIVLNIFDFDNDQPTEILLYGKEDLESLPKMLLSGLANQYKRGGCNATYYGKTKRHFKLRICEHLDILHLTEKKVKIDNNKLTAIQEHLLCCNYSPSFDDFSILIRESNDFKLKIM